MLCKNIKRRLNLSLVTHDTLTLSADTFFMFQYVGSKFRMLRTLSSFENISNCRPMIQPSTLVVIITMTTRI